MECVFEAIENGCKCSKCGRLSSVKDCVSLHANCGVTKQPPAPVISTQAVTIEKKPCGGCGHKITPEQQKQIELLRKQAKEEVRKYE